MYSYVARRPAFGLLTVIGVSIMVFVIVRILPGDPLVAIFGPDGFTKLTEEQRANYMRELGLSDPLWVQYLVWARQIAEGNFGRSFFRSESVANMLVRRAPLTAEIALLSVVISWAVGIPVAIVSALKPNAVADSAARFISILFLAVPGFWVGMLIVLGLGQPAYSRRSASRSSCARSSNRCGSTTSSRATTTSPSAPSSPPCSTRRTTSMPGTRRTGRRTTVSGTTRR